MPLILAKALINIVSSKLSVCDKRIGSSSKSYSFVIPKSFSICSVSLSNTFGSLSTTVSIYGALVSDIFFRDSPSSFNTVILLYFVFVKRLIILAKLVPSRPMIISE